jgi:hypothetical protein
MLTIQVRVWWWNNTEEKRLKDDDIKQAKENYYKNLDDTVTDRQDFDDFIIVLNEENRQNYISNKLGSRNKDNIKLNLIDKYILKRSQLEKYNALYFRILRKADKLKKIKSGEITSLTELKLLYDSKNYLKIKRKAYHFGMSIISFIFTTLIASVVFKELTITPENAFRFTLYLFSIVWTLGLTILTASKIVGTEVLDHIVRLQDILEKYKSYKGGKKDGGMEDSTVNRVSENVIRANATEPERTELV